MVLNPDLLRYRFNYQMLSDRTTKSHPQTRLKYISMRAYSNTSPKCLSMDPVLPVQVGRNIIHGSDAVESAQHEINLWFR